jgi:hypothetical protein
VVFTAPIPLFLSPEIFIAIVVLAALPTVGRILPGRLAITDADRRERTVLVARRLLVGLVVLAGLFGFVTAVADIVTSA